MEAEVQDIVVRGARQHNLRNVSITLPRDRLICFTGVSGSGKSSFAFDTLYAEGQRRYIESLSAYARQFLGQLQKPDVDSISGLSPTISIQQKAGSWNPRSTVATITQIHDYLRVLYARIGTQHCTQCSRPITAQSREQIIAQILALRANTQVMVLAPVVRGQKGEYRDLFEDMLKAGYVRARVNGQVVQLSDDPALERNRKHNIEIVIDRLAVSAKARNRLAEAVAAALQLGQGTLIVATKDRDILLSSKYACLKCNLSFEPPSPQMFSFNSPSGMCPGCDGLGETSTFDPELLVPDKTKSFLDLAIEPMRTRIGRWRRHTYEAVAQHVGFDLATPWSKLSQQARDALLYGTGDEHLTFEWKWRGGIWRHGGTFAGVIAELEEKYRKAKAPTVRKFYEKYVRQTRCPACRGARLNAQALAVRFGGRSLTEVEALPITRTIEFFESLDLTPTQIKIGEQVLREIINRLTFLRDVGLHYLTLDRAAPTLSGGESQRIRLASQIGSGLTGVLYVLDEPSIGLHDRDQRRLLDSLQRLRDLGNTVIVVEHDEQTMRAADMLVDFGPGPGVRGGHIVASGTLDEIAREKKSITAAYLTGKQEIEVPRNRRPVSGESHKGNGCTSRLTVVGAAQNNLKGIDVSIPLGRFVCVTGVSGSGKSSLVREIIREQLMKDLNGAEKVKPGKHTRINGKQYLDKVIDIDQSPIGRTPRSNPATYIKLFDEIRDLYARLPDSKVRGYKPGRFSFNVHTGKKGGGRCEACEGNGSNRIEMDFLADLWVTCPVCTGRRFNHETLQILYKGKSIGDVLEMDLQDALAHFENVPKIRHKLQTLHDVGLDYLKVGQPSNTLSGGEAQRVKLARELVKRSTGRTLYILDEPTTGLHFDDIKKLLAVLHGFVDAGNTVLVIEHNLDVIKTADWVIDLGPEGGDEGGRIVAEGTPEEVAGVRESHTGGALRLALGMKKRKEKRENPRAVGFSPRGSSSVDDRRIRVVGARQHNLKDISVDIPHRQTTVFTGLSGSGKSSLAMDTLYTEGQRRYVESLSAYARQFLGQLQKPAVEHIEGLPPAIAIEQKTAGHSPRSTVGTVTEIYDYLRVLYARLGKPHCPTCGQSIGTQTSDDIVERILALPTGAKALLLAPIERVGAEKYPELFAREKQNGYQRIRVDGTVYALDDKIPVQHRRRHTIELVVDRVVIKPSQRARISDSVEQALTVGNGVMKVSVLSNASNHELRTTNHELRFSQLFACNHCGISYDELTPHHFSFNTRLGWCESCEGLGTQQGASMDALIANPNKSILDGAIAGWEDLDVNPMLREALRVVLDHLGINPAASWRSLSPEQQRLVLHGPDEDEWIEVDLTSRGLSRRAGTRINELGERRPVPRSARAEARGSLTSPMRNTRVQWKGFFPAIDQATKASWHFRKQLESLVSEIPCKVCSGSRLQRLSRHVRFGDQRRSLTIHDLCGLPLREALRFIKNLKFDKHDKKIAGELLHEVKSRLQFLVDVGLDYVSLHRGAPTLSGGESQRIRLASQIGSGLTGVLYVLDEPTIGLHPRDNRRLIAALNKLRDWGNTLCIVEHDRDVIRNADCILDFGPGAGREGGHIVAQGTPQEICKDRNSLTGKYLSGKEAITIPTNRREVDLGEEHRLDVLGCRHNNLKDIDVSFPLGRFIAVTGVSGSGKSSLVNDILYKALASRIHRARLTPGSHDEIEGLAHVDKVINVDQTPIGQTPSSNPATYTKMFDVIRELFAKLTDAKVRGYTARRFSFNRPGGRCEECGGFGEICIEMHFMSDVWIKCEECGGRRYNPETLEVKYKGRSIADVLEMRVSEGIEHFKNVPKVRAILQTLIDVGLGYIQLGQSATTLSGGEAQRVKLAAELARRSTGKTVYILDEPTTGLHFEDCKKLLDVLHRLVDLGNTVICIEHNMDLIKTADWIIDIGPEAGDEGGEIVVADTPELVGRCKKSHTGKILADVLEEGSYAEREVFSLEEAAKRQARIESPLALVGAESEVKLPWEINGRRWHTRQCLASDGERPRWDSEALEWLVDQMEAHGALQSADWNHRSRIEIRAPGSKSTAWLCHILTRGPWLLECTFRVAKRSFDARKLNADLGLKTLDEREDLPVYGQWRRVKRRVRREFDDIRIHIHDLAEIDTPAFRRFLKSAVDGYLKTIGQWEEDPESAEPWKTDGLKWHMAQKAIAPNRRKLWKPTLLMELIGRLNKCVPDLTLDWNHKTVIAIKHPAMDKPWGKIVTSSRFGLRVELRTESGRFTPAKIDRLGPDPEIKRNQNHDWVMFTFQSMDQIDASQLKSVMLEAEESLLGRQLEFSS